MSVDRYHNVGTSWQKITFAFTPSPGINEVSLSFGRDSSGADGIDFDDVRVFKV